jgi:hypothetical protein
MTQFFLPLEGSMGQMSSGFILVFLSACVQRERRGERREKGKRGDTEGERGRKDRERRETKRKERGEQEGREGEGERDIDREEREREGGRGRKREGKERERERNTWKNHRAELPSLASGLAVTHPSPNPAVWGMGTRPDSHNEMVEQSCWSILVQPKDGHF